MIKKLTKLEDFKNKKIMFGDEVLTGLLKHSSKEHWFYVEVEDVV